MAMRAPGRFWKNRTTSLSFRWASTRQNKAFTITLKILSLWQKKLPKSCCLFTKRFCKRYRWLKRRLLRASKTATIGKMKNSIHLIWTQRLVPGSQLLTLRRNPRRAKSGSEEARKRNHQSNLLTSGISLASWTKPNGFKTSTSAILCRLPLWDWKNSHRLDKTKSFSLETASLK